MATDLIYWPDERSTEWSHSIFDPQRMRFKGGRDEWLIAAPMPGMDEWSLLARSREAQRRAREVLRAFVGPAVGALKVSERQALLTVGNDSFDVLSTPITVRDGKEAQMVAATERMVNVLAGQPEQVPVGPLSVSALLRDFRLALSDGDDGSATYLLGQLQAHPHLSRMNRQFLEVEFLARLGRWQELRRREWFVALLTQRRPASITEFMLEAVWRIDFEQQSLQAWSEAKVAFSLLPDAVRAAPDGIEPSRTPVRRLCVLRAVEQGSELRIANLVDSDPTLGAWIGGTGVRAEPVLPENQPSALNLLDSGRIADLIELVQRFDGRPSDVAIAVRGVAEYESASLAPQLLGWLDRTSAADLPDSPGFRSAVAKVRSLAEDRCEGWGEWLRRVAGLDHWPAAVEVARSLSEGWALEELDDVSSRVSAAEHIETAIEGPNAEAIDQVLDLLCSLVADLVERHGADALVGAVALALLYRTPSAKTVEALVGLVAVVLEHSPTETAYGDLATACSREEVVRPRAHIASLLDLLDAFVARPRLEPHFSSFVGTAQGALIAHRSHGRLDGEELRLAAELLTEAGRPTPSLEPGTVERADHDPWALLAGKTVFLYTLFNGLGARFERRLRERCPTVQVKHSAETHASDRLRQLAAGADYVIVHTRHASHAATIGIDQVVPRSQQVLANGKGASSLILTLHAELEPHFG